MKKPAFLVLALLLFSSAVIIGIVQPVAAQGTIYIKPDGSIDPATSPIHHVGTTYNFAGNIHAYIIVEKDSIVLDGAGYSLEGTGSGTGITLADRNNVTIKNVKLKNFDEGIYLWASSNSTLSENDISANNVDGILIANLTTNNNLIFGNNITNNGHGIGFSGTSNRIIGNYIANNNEGIYFGGNQSYVGASNNNFYHNSFVNNAKQINDYYWTDPLSLSSINTWDNGKEGNYWSDYPYAYPNAEELGDSGIWNTPYLIDANNTDRYPLMHRDTTPPNITIVSPENKPYPAGSISLTFTVNEPTFRIAYSLDGQANVAITTNTTLTELLEDSHSVIVYATDSFGNTGVSIAVHFAIDSSPPRISILLPENRTYDTTDVSLTFELTEPASWMAYSLDGQKSVTVIGNVTLAVLPEGSHSIAVYANDTAGNVGVSKIVYFSIATFPIMWIVAAIAIAVIIGATLLIYFKKVKKTIKTVA
jgi:parallel beta-helix repeat protein